MKKIQKVIKIFLLILFVFNSWLFSLTFKELIKKLEDNDNKIKKLKAEYVQLIHFLDLNETYVLKAKFIYEYPEKLRIDIQSPFKQIIVVNDKKLFAKDVLNDVIYYTDTEKYFEKQKNYFPLIFSKTRRYNLADFVKKTGLRFIKEENKYYVLSSRYLKGKKYTGDEKGFKKDEVRLMLWLDKEKLLPEKVNMVSEKYVIETEFSNYETEFEITDALFEIEKTSNTKIIEIK
ncbi:MAG: LolA family protein [Endomicrobiia bacterium]